MKNLPEGLIVTGINQGAGSTTVAAGLARICAEKGVKTGVMCPVETGIEDPEAMGPAARLMKWAARSQQQDEQISPYRFKADLDAASAATKQNTRIDFNQLVQTAQNIRAEHDFTIIDASGGLMVPLAGGLLMADFAAMLKLPMIVVTAPGRDAINHTLLTLYAAKQMNIEVAGYLINKMPMLKSLREEDMAHALAYMTSEELLGILSVVKGSHQEQVNQLAQEIPALQTFFFIAPYLPGR